MNIAQIEAAVVGTLIEFGNDALPPHLSELLKEAPESFDDLGHGELAAAVRALRRDKEPVHRTNVIERIDIERFPNVEAVVTNCEHGILPPALAELEAERLLVRYRARQLQQALADASQQLEANPQRVGDVAAMIREAANEIAAKTAAPVAALPLHSFVNYGDKDPDELLKHRFLCRGGGLLLAAQTGIGKSTFHLQACMLWALGREAFGIQPAKPLSSLIIQSENDGGDIAEQRDGVFAGAQLSEDERRKVGEKILVIQEDSRTGNLFFTDVVLPALEQFSPDLLVIDPALAYLGGESASQKDVGGFLRNMLNPAIRRFKCGVIVVHHTNKPPKGKEKPDWRATDFAYLGNGSAEWANWARAVLAIRSIGSHDLFELYAAKRGARLRWRDTEGAKAYRKFITHSREHNTICWHEVDPDEVETGGRPKSTTAEDLLSVLPAEGLTSTEWKQAAKEEHGVSERSFFRERKALEKAGRILKSKVSGKWQPVNKR